MLIAISTVTVLLAGCAGDDPPDSNVVIEGGVGDDFQLAAGTGAIAGLLVDDRFRPIQLVDAAETEFQAEGFILLQELGLRAKTDANGLFTFIDLEPGTYTLRVTASGHEATPITVRVTEAIFEEVNIVARRIASAGSFIITEEQSAFLPCAASWAFPPGGPDAINFSCLDSSGESWRSSADTNFTEFTDVHALVIEVRVAREGNWDLEVRESTGGASGGERWAESRIRGGQYTKVIIPYIAHDDETWEAPEDWPEELRQPWDNTREMESIIFYAGDYAGGYTVPGIPGATPPCITFPTLLGTRCWDLSEDWEAQYWGVAMGVRSQYILSLFIGEPAVDLEAYHLLTEDSS